jgi:uncharacterized protein YgiM (DUF1202 family)
MPRNKKARVIKSYRSAFPDPLIIKAGEVLKIKEKESEWEGWIWCVSEQGKPGWVPNSCLEISGESGTALRDYDATELSVGVGEELTVLEEESGWYRCVNENDRTGWVPAVCLKIKE